jgi:hypothetical protein
MDGLIDANSLLLSAFIAYLVALVLISYSARKSSSETPKIVYAVPPQVAQQLHQPEPPKPKIYKHTITASPNIIKTQGLLKQLEEQGISYTLTKHEKGNATIEFKTDKVLQNIEELKKKGVILDAKVEEAKDNDPAVV